MLEQRRSTQRKMPCGAVDEPTLTKNIIALARKYGRYGYRRVKALRRSAGLTVNRKRLSEFGDGRVLSKQMERLGERR